MAVKVANDPFGLLALEYHASELKLSEHVLSF